MIQPLPGPGDRTVHRSEELLERSLEVIPNATQTNAKAATGNIQGVSPAFIRRGAGSRCWDVDGNEYIDYGIACASNVLGYNYPEVRRAVQSQLSDGKSYSKPHEIEIEVAERLVELVPCAEMVRFGKNGNDVTSAAARIARAHTDRNRIASYGYHGFSWTGGAGVPNTVEDLTVGFEYNNLDSVEEVFQDHPAEIAAVVMNPYVNQHPENGFLEGVREIAHREGALLIFDEVKTGFRFAEGGAQEYYGVTPDLAAMGKAMANGYPLSALVGRSDLLRLLEDDVTFTLTYGGETLSLGAAKTVLDIHRDEPVHEHLYKLGGRLKDGFNDLAAEYGLDHQVECQGSEVLSKSSFRTPNGERDEAAERLFQQTCTELGVLSTGGGTPSYSHTDEEVTYTLEAFDEAFAVLADAIADGTVADRLKGDVVGTPVRLS